MAIPNRHIVHKKKHCEHRRLFFSGSEKMFRTCEKEWKEKKWIKKRNSIECRIRIQVHVSVAVIQTYKFKCEQDRKGWKPTQTMSIAYETSTSQLQCSKEQLQQILPSTIANCVRSYSRLLNLFYMSKHRNSSHHRTPKKYIFPILFLCNFYFYSSDLHMYNFCVCFIWKTCIYLMVARCIHTHIHTSME